MRHSCAHSLARQNNNAKQISLVLGHKSEKTTSDTYLRDDHKRGCEGMLFPSHWNDDCVVKQPPESGADAKNNKNANSSTAPLEPVQQESKGKDNLRPKTSTKKLLEQALDMFGRI